MQQQEYNNMVKRTFCINGQKFTADITKEGNDYVSICEEVGTTDFGDGIKRNIKMKIRTCPRVVVPPFVG